MSYLVLAYNRVGLRPPERWGRQFDSPPCGEPLVLRADGVDRLGNTEVNPPLPYLPAAVGLWIGRSIGGNVGAFFGARFAQMVSFVVLVWFALRLLPWGRPFLFAVALIPASIQLSGTISADPVTNGLAFVTIAGILRLIDQTHRSGRQASSRALVGLGAVIVLFALTKPATIPIVALAAAIPTAAFGSLRRRLVAVGAPVVAAGAIGLAWSIGVVSHIRVAIFPSADSIAMASWLKAHPGGFVAGVARAWTDLHEVHRIFSELVTIVTADTYAPLQPVRLLGALVAMLVVARVADPVPRWLGSRWMGSRLDHRNTDRDTGPDTTAESGIDPETEVRPLRQRRFEIVLAIGVFIVGFVLIEVGVALSAVKPGSRIIRWVQGRYFIPFLPLVLFGAHAARGRLQSLQRVALVPIVFLVGLNLWWLSVVLRTFYSW